MKGQELWYFKSLWQFFETFTLHLGNYLTYFGKFLYYWANFHWCKWPNIEKYFCHSVTLVTTDNLEIFLVKYIRGFRAQLTTDCKVMQGFGGGKGGLRRNAFIDGISMVQNAKCSNNSSIKDN